MTTEMHSTPEERAAKRVKDRTDVMWHLATYVIVNVFLWLIVPQAAFWVTVGWGIGVAFHVAYYFIGDDGPENPRYQKYLAEERAREERDQAWLVRAAPSPTTAEASSSTITCWRQLGVGRRSPPLDER